MRRTDRRCERMYESLTTKSAQKNRRFIIKEGIALQMDSVLMPEMDGRDEKLNLIALINMRFSHMWRQISISIVNSIQPIVC